MKVSKTDGGKTLYADDYAYVPDPADPSSWKLRIDDEGHVQDALSRFNQTELPSTAKAAVAGRIVKAAHKYGIDTTNFEREHVAKLSGVVTLDHGPAQVIQFAAREDGLVRVPVIRTGKFVQGARRLDLSPDLLKQMVHNFSDRAVEVPLSYEHTIEKPDVAQGQPIPAAGWIKELEAQPDSDGVLWGWAQLTDEARNLVKTDQYKYVSPAFAFHYPNHKTGRDQGGTLLSVALTNRPFLDMPAVTLSVVLPAGDETNQTTPASAGKGTHMAKMAKVKVSPIKDGEQKGHLQIDHPDFPKTEDGEQKTYFADAGDVKTALDDADGDSGGENKTEAMSAADAQKLVLLSGIAGATRVTPEVVTAIATKISGSAKTGQVIGLSAVPVKDGKRDYFALNVSDGASVSGEVFRAMQADAELSAAIASGKVLPAQREYFERIAQRDLQLFRDMVGVMGPQVQLGVAGSGAGDGSTTTLSAEEIAVAKQLGNDPQKVAEAKRAQMAR